MTWLSSLAWSMNRFPMREAVKRKCAELTESVPDGAHGELPTMVASPVRGSGTHSMKAGKTIRERFPAMSALNGRQPGRKAPKRDGRHGGSQ